jgi:hypothetical protein
MVRMLTRRVDYLIGKDKLNKDIAAHVENKKKLSRKAQLESYDGCSRLRPIWDDIARKYDAVSTPSVVDEAPVGIASTGDAVSPHYLIGLHRLIMYSHFVLCGQFCRFQL